MGFFENSPRTGVDRNISRDRGKYRRRDDFMGLRALFAALAKIRALAQHASPATLGQPCPASLLVTADWRRFVRGCRLVTTLLVAVLRVYGDRQVSALLVSGAGGVKATLNFAWGVSNQVFQ